MRIIAKKTLKDFWKQYPDEESGLKYWYGKVERADYQKPSEVISDFKGADFVGNDRIVFNITKNKYRLIASFNYEFRACWIKFIGTHKEYERIDAKTVEF